ncbi:helicase SNF [Sesbania bispinosa]|nr:helicase SNF [Sesbania bispinosa]
MSTPDGGDQDGSAGKLILLHQAVDPSFRKEGLSIMLPEMEESCFTHPLWEEKISLHHQLLVGEMVDHILPNLMRGSKS